VCPRGILARMTAKVAALESFLGSTDHRACGKSEELPCH